MHNIFLSYSRDDLSLMKRLRDGFRQVGFTVWTDERIEPGSPSWKMVIEEAIRNTDCLVVIFSPSAAKSKWVRAELDFAEAQNKPIFSVLARGDKSNAVPFGYSSHQWVDMRLTSDYNARFIDLTNAIAHHLEKTPLGLDTLQKQMPSTASTPKGLPLRLLISLFIIGVVIVGFIGLVALNDSADSDDNTSPTTTSEAVLIVDDPAEPNADSESETRPITRTTLENGWTSFSNGRVRLAVPAGWIEVTNSDLFEDVLGQMGDASESMGSMLSLATFEQELLLTTASLRPIIAIVGNEIPFDITLDTMESLIRNVWETPDVGFTIDEMERVALPIGTAIRFVLSFENRNVELRGASVGYIVITDTRVYMVAMEATSDDSDIIFREIIQTFEIIETPENE